MKPSAAAASMDLPPGFKANLFAAEPDVQNPIAMAWDSRGRLWIAENYTYAEAPTRFDLSLRDRIVILEDALGEGRFSKRSVFTDELQMLTSLELGRGGVWAMCPPQLLFIPMAADADIPSGPPRVVLDGFNVPLENYHNFANGLRWGPDGWLYGRSGASAPGEIGVPGTPSDERIPLRGGIWRYHPEKKIFEALNSGTTNPWGHDWDKHGELFFVNTVNGHLWHGIVGAHFVPGTSIDPNNRTYALIDQHADHWHFDTSQGWTKSRDGAANSLGGGHAHIGAMIYKGNNWPLEFRDNLFTFNMHGLRLNREILEREGSGFAARHGRDFLTSADSWFRGIDLSSGPDGAVYAIDWSDTGECHERNGVHRTSGRVFKIQYRDGSVSTGLPMTALDSLELVRFLEHPNDWQASMARRLLAERATVEAPSVNVVNALHFLFESTRPVPVKLHVLWTLHAMGATSSDFLRRQLKHDDEAVRVWAIRLLTDSWRLDNSDSKRPKEADTDPVRASFVDELVGLARTESSALVRLTLASTLQRLPVAMRARLASELSAHSEDAHDHNLPLMVWYGLIPVADSAPEALVAVADSCAWPQTRQLIARRIAEEVESRPELAGALIQAALKSPSLDRISDLLQGLADGLKGWRKARKPQGWDALCARVGEHEDADLREKVRDLSVLFGDGRALDEVRKVALDKTAALSARKSALQTLLDNKEPRLRAVCEELLSTRFLNPLAARGLASFNDPEIGEKLVRAYGSFHQTDRPQLIAAIVSRATFVPPLLDAIENGKIPRGMLTAFDIRQIRSFHDPSLDARLASVWGDARESTADRKAQIAAFRKELSPENLANADRSQGRVLFQTVCGSCHMMYGEGGKIAPDLTGAGRDNLDYLLENIVDPSAVVGADFRMNILRLKDGRVLNGMLSNRTERTFTVQTMTEALVVERSEVLEKQELSNSLMPEGLLDALNAVQRRDLIGYLLEKTQAPLPK